MGVRFGMFGVCDLGFLGLIGVFVDVFFITLIDASSVSSGLVA